MLWVRLHLRTPIVMVVMMMVMFFALRSDCPPLQSQKGTEHTQYGIIACQSGPQAHRAHQQTKDGCIIATSLAHFNVCTIFSQK